MTDQERIAKFLAEKGATQVAPGLAYGVSAEADKAKRAEARAAQRAAEEGAARERRAEAARDAFFSGDKEGGDAILTGYERTAPGRYRRVRFDRFLRFDL